MTDSPSLSSSPSSLDSCATSSLSSYIFIIFFFSFFFDTSRYNARVRMHAPCTQRARSAGVYLRVCPCVNLCIYVSRNSVSSPPFIPVLPGPAASSRRERLAATGIRVSVAKSYYPNFCSFSSVVHSHSFSLSLSASLLLRTNYPLVNINYSKRFPREMGKDC